MIMRKAWYIVRYVVGESGVWKQILLDFGH